EAPAEPRFSAPARLRSSLALPFVLRRNCCWPPPGTLQLYNPGSVIDNRIGMRNRTDSVGFAANPMRYKTILLFGAPGSGKGTQGKILGAIPGFYHTACGDVFRSLDLQTEMGRIFWEYSSRGELVPDEFTVKLWKNYIKGMEMINEFQPETEILILDGIPRNQQQAELMDETLDVVKVIYLVCAD